MTTLINEKKLAEAVNEGLENLSSIMKTDNPSKDAFSKARIAASLLSTTARIQATQNSMISLRFRVASSILKSAKEKRDYLTASSPELKLLKG